eukprot:9001032-Ditylum_brightwellii.AAC.1
MCQRDRWGDASLKGTPCWSTDALRGSGTVKGTNNSHGIRRRIDHRLDLWEAGEYEQLVEDTVATARQQLPANQRQESDVHVTK